MTGRYVEVGKLSRAVQRAMAKSPSPDPDPAHVKTDVLRWAEKQPVAPDLVGVAEASKILDLPKPRISRLRSQGKMPSPVAELESGPVWVRQDVEALAERLAQERAAREARRAERDKLAATKAEN